MIQQRKIQENHSKGKNILKLLDQSVENTSLSKFELPGNLNESLLAVAYDLDPEQGVEDEYKKRNDPIFIWKFMRLVAEADLTKFHNKLAKDKVPAEIMENIA